MIIDESLKDKVRESSSEFLFNNFKKVINELNFKDGMSGVFRHSSNYCECCWIEVVFDNSWRLTVWNDGTFNLFHICAERDDNTFALNYQKLLKFMDKNKLRKAKKCGYKDAELYIIDFNK